MVANSPTPVPPPLAVELFADRLPLAVRYVEWFTGAGVERGLVGPREADRVWTRHVLNCAAVGALIDRDAGVVDIGSGAGLPGIVLAIARPDLRVTLVESMLRRTTFLEEVVADLGLDSVTVTRARAEDLRKAHLDADVVTARAVAPIERLATWALPLLREGGEILALKGAGAAEEIGTGWPVLRRLRLADGPQLVAVVAGAKVEGADSPLLASLNVVDQGHWSESAGGCVFVPPAGAEIPDDDRLALIVRLTRAPKPISQHAAVGLG